MKKPATGFRITALLLVIAAATTARASWSYFPLPSPASLPQEGITGGPDGNVWFSEVLTGRIGRITVDGAITEFQLPSSAAPREIVLGADSNLWFADPGRNVIGRITPSGVASTYAVTSDSLRMREYIATGPDGNLWFALTDIFGTHGPDAIGKITTAGVVTLYRVLAPGSLPSGIAAGADGNIWFTEFYANRIGRISPAGSLVEFTIPTPDSRPLSITRGPDGNVWFTELAGNKVGRITPSGEISEFDFPLPNASLFAITSGSDHNLWLACWPNFVGRMTLNGQVTLFFPPGSGVIGVTQGPDGKIWVTENVANALARLDLEDLPTPYSIPTLTPQLLALLVLSILLAALFALRQFP